MRIPASLLMLLCCVSPVVAQHRTQVTAPSVPIREVTLELGKYHTFVFATDDNKPPFGGKDYVIEVESGDGLTAPTWWRGLFAVDGNIKNLAPANLLDTAIFFASDDSPDVMSLRAISENRTVYRAKVTVNKKKPVPTPSPYLDQIRKSVALDKAAVPEVLSLAVSYGTVATGTPGYKIGRDMWNAIGVEYLRLSAGSLIQTRDAISKILMDTTYKYYVTPLDDASRKIIRQVALDIQSALEAAAANPGPAPPTPGPVDPATPAPIPVDGFRVMIIYKTADLGKLPAAQYAMVRGSQLRDYLNKNCVQVGGNPEWRIWTDDITDLSGESKLWQDAYKRNHNTLPWILVSNGKTGFEGQLPLDWDSLQKLLDKYRSP